MWEPKRYRKYTNFNTCQKAFFFTDHKVFHQNMSYSLEKDSFLTDTLTEQVKILNI